MNKEDLSLLLGIVGLILGIISAHAQLRAMGRWALQTGGNRARAWMTRLENDASLYASNPSALISFLAKETLSMIWFVFFAIGLIGVLKGKTISAPPWVVQVVFVFVGVWVGNKLSDVSSIVERVLKKAKAAVS